MALRVNGSLDTTLMDHPDYRRGDPHARAKSGEATPDPDRRLGRIKGK